MYRILHVSRYMHPSEPLIVPAFLSSWLLRSLIQVSQSTCDRTMATEREVTWFCLEDRHLELWLYFLWKDLSKNKIKICVILAWFSGLKIYTQWFLRHTGPNSVSEVDGKGSGPLKEWKKSSKLHTCKKNRWPYLV